MLQNSTTVTQVVEFYLRQIEDNRHLNAYVEIFDQEARDRAALLDQQREEGTPLQPLHGVIIGIKDVLCYEGHYVSAASNMLHDFRAPYSATCIQRLTDAGAIIIGRLNCDEFAMGSSNEHSAFGPVLNALDNDRVPGGSSGGSAVAVQANLCMVSLGSDTGGSVRQPADFCGIVGLKPSYGRISRYGLIAYASSFDQVGIFSRNLADAAKLLEIMAGADNFDSTSATTPVPAYSSAAETTGGPKKFAYFKEAVEHPALDPEIRAALLEYFGKLRQAGHQVDAVDFPLLDYIVPTYYVLTTAEASSNLSRYDGVRYGHQSTAPAESLAEFYAHNRSEGFGREVKRRIMLGSFVLSAGYYDAYFTKAQQVRKQLFDRTQLIFNDFDAILSPTAPSPAFRFGEKSQDPVAMYLEDIYTVFANLTGIPAVSLPFFWHSNGMPFGLQVMTNRFEELSLFQIAEAMTRIAR
ncbi:Asp-tRNA(Asn)/Glu-tRNA(Gln) amidotransferase subunit GatA [Flavihumibacter petaseus]|uniref:Asp-tRNA(Asn)/Glu-tRNA(Gln) amidotransferase subunit GatA n=1 Tax=Flavihumibacter petaseus TaxID=549295 RepID=UPI001FE20D1B|nr:Asp-tRNA(Asn)/Glu-tRNA(Gln) amidotransferase subunit GatA [Flavihumibacter petaseus]